MMLRVTIDCASATITAADLPLSFVYTSPSDTPIDIDVSNAFIYNAECASAGVEKVFLNYDDGTDYGPSTLGDTLQYWINTL